MKTILIGIDDTDNETSPGTGRLARDLNQIIIAKGCKSLGVTRHQFLIDSAIPYTSHNSGACVAIATEKTFNSFDFVFDHIAKISADGSDPGVCIAFAEDVPDEISAFGSVAQEKVLQIEQAFNTAKGKKIKLHGLGGNCQGVIGALGSVGLRAGGNDGRFIDLPGLRQLPNRLNCGKFEEIGIKVEHRVEKRDPCENDVYDTLGWARPRLIGGDPVLIVEWSENQNVWIPLDRKKKWLSKYT